MKFVATLLVLALIATSAFAASPKDNAVADIADFIIGFADGLEVTLNGNASQCVAQAGTTFDEFSLSYQLIQTGLKKKSASLVGQGIEDFGLALQQIPTVLQICGATEFIDEIKSIAEELASGSAGIIEVILKEALNIFTHRQDITSDFEDMISSFNSGSYQASGDYAGTIVGILISGATA
ncbi:hypothetical protein DLAC_03653 [Tieghemostelium lacteum]|uniref:Uncharacterized protein n=1 Tax=Tieghemostelium lacteum TaxID=361077 RepID=A0A152A0I4_TIELA|nr:hypothetical protein DLAC_03653 [Tieghemostelium lacteum]|eukprot:KYQ99713.1 hypothetical protein DLAC_03653 [Tieghemostelium lacteum]